MWASRCRVCEFVSAGRLATSSAPSRRPLTVPPKRRPVPACHACGRRRLGTAARNRVPGAARPRLWAAVPPRSGQSGGRDRAAKRPSVVRAGWLDVSHLTSGEGAPPTTPLIGDRLKGLGHPAASPQPSWSPARQNAPSPAVALLRDFRHRGATRCLLENARCTAPAADRGDDPPGVAQHEASRTQYSLPLRVRDASASLNPPTTTPNR